MRSSFTPLLAAACHRGAIAHRQYRLARRAARRCCSREWSADPRGAITAAQSHADVERARPAAGSRCRPISPRRCSSSRWRAPPGVSARRAAGRPAAAGAGARARHPGALRQYLSTRCGGGLGAADAWLWLDRPGGAAHADCCMFARQGDWIRVGQLLLRDGNYRGDRGHPSRLGHPMRAPAKSDPDFGALYARGHGGRGRRQEGFAAPDVYVVGGRGGNRLWLIPSMQLAVLCTGEAAGRDAAWDETRIPNLIMRGARDYLPPAPAPGSDMSQSFPAIRRRSKRSRALRRQLGALFLFCVIDTLGFRHPHPARALHGGPLRRGAAVHHARSRQLLVVSAACRAALGPPQRSLRTAADPHEQPRRRVRVLRDARFASNVWWLLASRMLAGLMAGNIAAAFAYASDV